MQLPDRVAIVTGGGSGIGRAISRGLSREGAKVAVCDLNLAAAKETAAALGSPAVAIKADVSRPEDVDRMVKEAMAQFGRLDILVNNAGICPRTPVLEMDVEEWDRVLATNLRSVFLCCKAAAQVMKAQGGGKIINVTSGRGIVGMSGSAHYAASKGGVTGFTRTMGLEWAQYGIHVNAVGPGITDTPLVRAIHTEEQLKQRASIQPDKRLGSPEDVVGAVIFLCSDASDAMYGQIIYIKTP